MNYIYGDATKAPFNVDYLQLLRNVLEFSVEHLLSEQQRHSLNSREISVRGAADAEVKHIEELSRVVVKALDATPTGAEGSAVARAAQAIIRATAEQVRAAVDGVRAQQQAENAQLAELGVAERLRSRKALEKLLLGHDLPDTSYSIYLTQAGGSRYVGRIATTSGLGVDAVLELEITKDAGALTPIARVERFAPGLELSTPESGGWLRKETRLRPQKADKLCLVELSIGEGGSFKLRTNPDGTGTGHDFKVSDDGRVTAAYLNEKGELTAYELPAEEANKLHGLFAKITEAAGEARFFRSRLVDVTLDGDPYADHEEPTVLIERLIEELAPNVQEIARRSKSSDELIIKRVTGDNRREELFIAKAELLAILAPVPTRFKQMFAPLGLGEGRPSSRPSPVERAPSKAPPPIPSTPPAAGSASEAPAMSMPPSVTEVGSGDWEIPEQADAAPSSKEQKEPAPNSGKPAMPPPSLSGSPKPPPTSKRS